MQKYKMNNKRLLIHNENKPRMGQIFRYILVGCIFLYPFIHTFLGIDLGDTGYHYYAFEKLFTQTEFISFTSYFSNIIGWIWLKLFGDLGLWGLNLLEVLVEMLLSYVVYKTYSPWLGKNNTLIGILVAIFASDTYLNIFNYHQFNVLLITIMLCMEFQAIYKDNIKFSVIAGAVFAIAVFSRTGSVTALVSLLLYVIWYFIYDKNLKFLLKHFTSYIIAAIVTSMIFIATLYATGQLQYFIKNVFRLSDLASGNGSYGMENLLSTFILGNLDAMSSGCLFLSVSVILIVAFGLLTQKQSIKMKMLNIFVAVLLCIIGLYQLKKSYDINPVPGWPQMTTGPSFIIGVMYIVTIICMIVQMYSENGKREIALLCMIAIVLPLLTIAGSNTGTKHVILGLWMIAPVSIYTVFSVFEKEEVSDSIIKLFTVLKINIRKGHIYATTVILIIAFCVKFTHMMYYTTNFDSIDRSSLNSYIDNDKVKWIRTTQRQADAVNGVLDELEKVDENRKLMLFGGSLMFYTMTGRDSFVQPWVSNSVYDNNLLINDMKKGLEDNGECPVVIYCRTNNYYGFYEEKYNSLIQSQLQNDYEGKKQIFFDFLKSNHYKLTYINDYYLVLLPEELVPGNNYEYYDEFIFPLY